MRTNESGPKSIIKDLCHSISSEKYCIVLPLHTPQFGILDICLYQVLFKGLSTLPYLTTHLLGDSCVNLEDVLINSRLYL